MLCVMTAAVGRIVQTSRRSAGCTKGGHAETAGYEL